MKGTLPEYLTAEEVGAWLKVPVNTLYYWRKTGRGPKATPVGRWLRYDRSECERWLRAQEDAA